MSLKQLRSRWIDGDYDELLETLLLRYVFEFERTAIEFNKIASEVKQNMNTPFSSFSAEDLRKIWTYIEVNKFRTNKSQTEYT